MKIKALLFVSLFWSSVSAMAETKYLNGKIERIETCKNGGGAIFLFFSDITGTTPSASNGCSNDIVLPFIQLNSVNGELTGFEKVILSQALSAHATGASVRVRFDDETRLLVSLAID